MLRFAAVLVRLQNKRGRLKEIALKKKQEAEHRFREKGDKTREELAEEILRYEEHALGNKADELSKMLDPE